MRKTSRINPPRARRALQAVCYASLLSAALLAVPSTSQASVIIETFDLTSDHCTGGCLGGASGGTITVTDNGTGSLIFDVTLASGIQFVDTGFDADFGFNLSGITSITYSGITSGFAPSPSPPGTNPQVTGSLMMDGTGTFDFGLACTACGTGGSNPQSGPLDFTISATGLDITDLTTSRPNGNGDGGGGQFFAVDVLGNGNTGAIDASSISSSSTTGGPQTSSGSPLPEPNTSALTWLGLAMIAVTFMVRGRSKRA